MTIDESHVINDLIIMKVYNSENLCNIITLNIISNYIIEDVVLFKNDIIIIIL